MTNTTNIQINRKQLCNFALIGLFVYLFIGLFSPTASAAGLDVGIHPPILQIEALPPASIKAPITIENFGQDPIELSIVIKPFRPSTKENGEVSFLSQGEPLPGVNPLIFQNIQVQENNHVVQSTILSPGQQKTVTVHIGILENEPASDYYFSVIFVSKVDRETQNTYSAASGGVSTNVLLSIGPKGKTQGVLTEFSTPLLVEKGPVPFTIRVQNIGKSVIVPKGAILIEDMFGQVVGKIDLLPVNILADSIRAIPDALQSPDATPPANLDLSSFNPSTGSTPLTTSALGADFHLSTPKAYWHESFLMGPYKASLTLSLSDKGPVFKKSVRFIGAPVYTLLAFAIAIAVVLFIARRVRSKR